MRERMARKIRILEVERVLAVEFVESPKGFDSVVIDDEQVGIRVILTHSGLSRIIGREAPAVNAHSVPPSIATAVP